MPKRTTPRVYVAQDSTALQRNADITTQWIGEASKMLVMQEEYRWQSIVFGVGVLDTGTSSVAPGFDTTNVAWVFDDTTDEGFHFSFHMPTNWKAGTKIYPRINWKQASATLPAWGMEYRAYGPGEQIPGSFTTGLRFTDGLYTYSSGTLAQTSTTKAIDMSGRPAWTIVEIKCFRDVSQDSLVGDASMTSISFHYEVDALGGDTVGGKT